MLRYTHFFSTHVGFYAAYGVEGASVSAVNLFGAINKADGEKYQYNCRYYNNQYDMGLGPVVTAGGVYRLDFGDCAFRVRAGIGYGEIISDSYSYSRQLRSADASSGPTYIDIYTIDPNGGQDYMTGEYYTYQYSTPAFVMSASAEFIYKFGRFYLLADAGLSGSPSRATCLRITTDTKSAYNPSNYAQAVAYDSYKGLWIEDEDSARTQTFRQGAGLFLHANIGIGISLGRSPRSANTRKSKFHEK